MMRAFSLWGVVALFVVAGCTSSRPAAQATPPVPPQERQRPPAKSDYQPYDDVITDEAKSSEGLFDAHMVEDDLFFEIPEELLGRELLLVSRIAQVPANLSGFINGGSKVGEQVVRWERRGKQVLLRRMAYQNVASDSLPIALSVQVNNFEPILQAFDIEAIAPDSDGVVINVTDLFTKDVPALSGLSPSQRTRFRVRRLDGNRSFIDTVKVFPENVNVRHTMTFEATNPPSNYSTGTLSMQMYQSMILLPEEPMMPRLADPRVGYFTVSQIDYGSEAQKADTRSYIRRWRLEPTDMAAYQRGELVEPKKPIIYYLDPGTPEQWRPYFCQGVEDWNEAFEAAGFKNAIQCRIPQPGDDFDPEDTRFSTVRYVASTTRNATGPSVSDPRSGEIIESDIIWYHNHIRSYRNRLMIETGAANPKARSLMLEEGLIAETMRRVIAHEIGHALGLPHNMIASSAYPVDSLRSPTFTAQYGVAATIMDYARQNYIAQPGDGVTEFIRKIGPYDLYSIEWGYRVFPDADTPQEEKPMLDRMIVEHADDPMYRYTPQRGGLLVNPDAQTEDIGDDPVQASSYAIANLQRVVPNLVAWTSTPGEDYTDLDEIYGELLGQWHRYTGHVLTVVGGAYENLKASDQNGPVYTLVPRAKQEEALQFLVDQVFETPAWLHDADLLRRIEHAGAIERIRRYQMSRLNGLLDPGRMQRLIEAEVFAPDDAYPLAAFMEDAKKGVWHELSDSRPAIDTYRRNLQRGYLERLGYLMTGDYSVPNFSFFWQTPVNMSQSDIPAFARAQLVQLRTEATQAARRTRDTATRYHLQDVVARIDTMLDTEG